MERQKQKALIADEGVPEIKSPMTVSDYERLGDIYFEQGNIDIAFVQYNKALHLDPGQNNIRYKIGCLFLKKGLAEEARQEFEEILKNNSNNSLNALTYLGLGRAYFKIGDYEKAKDSFLQATNLDASLWEAHNFIGIIYDQQRQFDAAITQYFEAIAIKPNISILFNNLGISFLLKGEYDKSAKSFSEALQFEPQDSKVYNNLALALFKLERYTEAFEAFRKGGSDTTAYNNLGYMYMTEGKNDKATEYFKRAIEMNPRFYVRAYENMKAVEEAAHIPSQQ